MVDLSIGLLQSAAAAAAAAAAQPHARCVLSVSASCTPAVVQRTFAFNRLIDWSLNARRRLAWLFGTM